MSLRKQRERLAVRHEHENEQSELDDQVILIETMTMLLSIHFMRDIISFPSASTHMWNGK